MNSNLEPIRAILDHLVQSPRNPDDIEAPEEPGLYSLFARDDLDLGFVRVQSRSLIYIGASSNLKQRNSDTHFSSKQTGFSTVRRTLGACLKDPLQLRAIPRGPKPDPSRITSYRFEPEGEERLTSWMRAHLHAAWIATSDPGSLEADVICEAEPLLNLTHWNNPYRDEIKRHRRYCGVEANGS